MVAYFFFLIGSPFLFVSNLGMSSTGLVFIEAAAIFSIPFLLEISEANPCVPKYPFITQEPLGSIGSQAGEVPRFGSSPDLRAFMFFFLQI